MINLKKFIFTSLISFLAAAVSADIIFSCKTPTGKLVQVQSKGNSYQYSFGRSNNPELIFSNPKTDVRNRTKGNWTYVGQTQRSNMIFKNNDYNYEVFYQEYYETPNKTPVIHKGVSVSKNSGKPTIIYCTNKEKAILNWYDEGFL